MKPLQAEEYIRIGNGGGFAGIETTFTVYRNGQFEQSGKMMASLKEEDVEQFISNIHILNLDAINWNHPGNLYKFIEYSLNGKIHKITWDSNAPDINNNLNLFYNHVNSVIQKSIK
jgi:hypothetical protein